MRRRLSNGASTESQGARCSCKWDRLLQPRGRERSGRRPSHQHAARLCHSADRLCASAKGLTNSQKAVTHLLRSFSSPATLHFRSLVCSALLAGACPIRATCHHRFDHVRWQTDAERKRVANGGKSVCRSLRMRTFSLLCSARCSCAEQIRRHGTWMRWRRRCRWLPRMHAKSGLLSRTADSLHSVRAAELLLLSRVCCSSVSRSSTGGDSHFPFHRQHAAAGKPDRWIATEWQRRCAGPLLCSGRTSAAEAASGRGAATQCAASAAPRTRTFVPSGSSAVVPGAAHFLRAAEYHFQLTIAAAECAALSEQFHLGSDVWLNRSVDEQHRRTCADGRLPTLRASDVDDAYRCAAFALGSDRHRARSHHLRPLQRQSRPVSPSFPRGQDSGKNGQH